MTVWALVGQLGSGKSLMATQRAVDYAAKGRKVAANFHIDFATATTSRRSLLSSASVCVLPSAPSVTELLALGQGGETEETAGLLILDECGTFLNSRTWDEKNRDEIIKWFLLSRKRKWDVIFICQSVGMLDKQIRDAVVEMTGRIRRTDRVKLPVVRVGLPRMHVATMRYGTNPQDVVADRWYTRGDHLFQCYDTASVFADQEGSYSVVPATHSKWRYKELEAVERLVHGWKPYAEVCLPQSMHKRAPKPKNRLVELLMRLPEPERFRHWQRFEALGAFG